MTILKIIKISKNSMAEVPEAPSKLISSKKKDDITSYHLFKDSNPMLKELKIQFQKKRSPTVGSLVDRKMVNAGDKSIS